MAPYFVQIMMFSHRKVDNLRAREREREKKEPEIPHLRHHWARCGRHSPPKTKKTTQGPAQGQKPRTYSREPGNCPKYR